VNWSPAHGDLSTITSPSQDQPVIAPPIAAGSDRDLSDDGVGARVQIYQVLVQLVLARCFAGRLRRNQHALTLSCSRTYRDAGIGACWCHRAKLIDGQCGFWMSLSLGVLAGLLLALDGAAAVDFPFKDARRAVLVLAAASR